MSRRIAAVVIALVAALTLSSCTDSPTQSDVVARVGDATLTRDALDEMVNNSILQTTLDLGAVSGDSVSLEQADNIISLWISLEALQSTGAAALDDSPSADSVLATLPENYRPQFDGATPITQTMISRFVALQDVLNANPDRNPLTTAIRSADVSVDSRYGYWDAERLAVIPFGTELAPLATTTSTAAA